MNDINSANYRRINFKQPKKNARESLSRILSITQLSSIIDEQR